MARSLKAEVIRYVQEYMEKALPPSSLALLMAPTATAKRDVLQIEVVVGPPGPEGKPGRDGAEGPQGIPGPRGDKGDTVVVERVNNG